MKPIKELQDLIHLDMDAIGAYQKAIDACEHDFVAAKLREFQADHGRHVEELSGEITRLGGKPEVKTDLKGFFIGGLTAVASRGTHSALRTMKSNEQLTTSTYRKALEHGELPVGARGLVQRNYADEQRHLEWIENALRQRIWEQQPAQHA